MRPLGNAQLGQLRIDVLSAAVHQNDSLAALPRCRDCAQHLGAPTRVFQKAAPQLDYFHPSVHARASVSANPHMRLKFCTACEAAPFSRLSITETITALRPPCSSV